MVALRVLTAPAPSLKACPPIAIVLATVERRVVGRRGRFLVGFMVVDELLFGGRGGEVEGDGIGVGGRGGDSGGDGGGGQEGAEDGGDLHVGFGGRFGGFLRGLPDEEKPAKLPSMEGNKAAADFDDW
ncbi:hypothetical protein HDV00_004832 [Rhizophlyctis rosea]|nr:hypothetical protein HDV00_004832 [Rhizophlyctis rosea]